MQYPPASGYPEEAASGVRAVGDFTATPALLRLVPLAVVIGLLTAGAALALLDAIAFLTNLLYLQRVSVHLVSPDASTLGAVSVLIPIGGGVVVGLLARFGSDRIRGHGIPEALETILFDSSTAQPRLALLKPIASAISIGTGGPFGAEGPIILTGGALGSVVGQHFHLTAAQRRALLAAGAAAGMSAVFGAPVGATLFAIELLAFEFRPRSTVLIALASATADAVRVEAAHAGLVPSQPIFPVPPHALVAGTALVGAAVVGIVTGLAAWLFTRVVYSVEELFEKLRSRLHWMWWPALGGAVIGLGGLLDRRALGVGYDSIHAELLGQLGIGALVLLFCVKLAIWSAGLGSGSSGGVLAPVLLMGAAVGGIVGHALPGAGPGVWALVGLAGAIAGAFRTPLTAIVFAFELTHDQESLLALLVAAAVAYLVSVLALPRSILTEKLARRGRHVSREYTVDPLETTFVHEVMATDVVTVDATRPLAHLRQSIARDTAGHRHRLYPVLDGTGRFVGVLPWSRVLSEAEDPACPVRVAMVAPSVLAFPDERLRSVADRMVASRIGVVPVVARGDPGHLVGLVSSFDILTARARLVAEEFEAERVLRLRTVAPRRAVVDDAPDTGDDALGEAPDGDP